MAVIRVSLEARSTFAVASMIISHAHGIAWTSDGTTNIFAGLGSTKTTLDTGFAGTTVGMTLAARHHSAYTGQLVLAVSRLTGTNRLAIGHLAFLPIRTRHDLTWIQASFLAIDVDLAK